MKKALAILLFSATIVGGTASAAFARNGADNTTPETCHHHGLVCDVPHL
jgi:hypothetical protein